jgi:Predicted enzyme related to lactoylglutathione lyase
MPGQIVHFELPSKDVDRASGFWSGLFGWQIGPSAMGEEFDYRMFQAADAQGGAIYPDPDEGRQRTDRLLRHRRHRKVDRQGA